MGAVTAVTDELMDALKALLGERLSTSAAVREQHGKDVSFHEGHPPDAVAFAETTEEVAEIVRLCAAHKTPIVPFGTGTSLEGHISALKGGVCIDLGRMNSIIEVNGEDLDCRVQAGVTRKQLNEYLRDTGLFFPIDPGADASLGGMAATRASGTNAVRYGTMRENVLGLTVVTADGRIIRTGGRARKSSAGYDLTRLFVGSEGTLGVITEVQLRLHGIPEAISAAVCPFETLEGAVNTVILTIQSGIPVARIELLDEVQMGACSEYSDLGYPALPTLFFEFHGTEAGVKEQAERVAELASEFGGRDFQWATQQEDRTRLWQARHDAYWAAKALKPGSGGWATDVCVPISRLAECIMETKRDIEESGLLAPLVGHVGDGNFHLVYLLAEGDEEEYRRASAHNDRMVMRAIAMGGTCTGEHGVGYGKIPFLQAEHGEAVALMRQIKQALDPDGIMNPGKVLPA
ncbi:FAD-binding oxidoreductase [Aquibaculum arenosum]|uniref:D-lactate dehydrogenase (cytochrome) n=1 Tax=Aquibaculum arenosum TaxID=3032591 RepID=A0ABT5YQG0_9PROT|nr:FAD-linked oxidase C-terminal domain-containing protein [Fodinicurvata sp. CAU 1616]MDF2096429.1 FAD-linked oxidase C-terminal domain-containing protein [Fodinicurvata sp. CAU 1616]